MRNKKNKLTKPEKQSKSYTDQAQEGERRGKALRELAQNPIFIITSLIFTVFGAIGGIPAVLQLMAQKSKKAKFLYSCNSVATGQINDTINKKTSVFVMISGVMTNEGETPIFPLGFKAMVSYGGAEYMLSPYRIPDNFSVPWRTKNVNYREAKDLQEIEVISNIKPIYGNLYFKSASINNIELTKAINEDSAKFEVICYDVKGKEYSAKFRTPKSSDTSTNFSIPKSGIYVE